MAFIGKLPFAESNYIIDITQECDGKTNDNALPENFYPMDEWEAIYEETHDPSQEFQEYQEKPEREKIELPKSDIKGHTIVSKHDTIENIAKDRKEPMAYTKIIRSYNQNSRKPCPLHYICGCDFS